MVQRARALSLIVIALGTGMIFVGCGGGGGGGGGAAQATITGTVLDDASLAPIRNAQVEVNGDITTTNAAGVFTLDTTSGNKTIHISKAGYQILTIQRNLQAGDNALGTQYLQPALLAGNGAATGTVRNNGTPVAGADVQSGGAQAVTKADGSFGIYNLPAGERGLLAVDPVTQQVGYTVVDITAGETTTGADIDLDLQPPGQPNF
ncbi:MAG: carboxypeptidase regulatory-like domain-containing protein [Armatimonadetes bacterium]|nr:carboxypeptidase regulatory-like domain-containing protein [Armatimonadota bacterium]